MNHVDYPVSNGHGWAVGAWTILVMAAVLGLASDQTSQLISNHFRFGERAIIAATTAVESVAKPTVSGDETLPFILTVPFAVTRTQRMVVARTKHRAEFARRVGQVRGAMKAAPGLLSSLALIGVSQAPGH